MKQIKKITIGCLLSMPIIANAQFNFTGFPINTYARTTVPMQKVAIGNFPTNASVQAKFHVSQFLLENNPATDGFLFRTDGSNAQTNSWSMFTGATAAILTERFRVAVPANSNNVVLFATSNGAMQFRTNNVQRMHIDGNVAPAIQGFVGIGTNFTTPQSRLHIHELDPFPPVNGGTATYVQWTNLTTGNADANQGLRVGITKNGTAEIRQQENEPLLFYNNNIENARILPAAATTMGTNVGMVGIGNWTTAFNTLAANVINAKLDIDGDLRIRTVTEDTTLLQVLVIDSTDHNRVHWRSISDLGGTVTADNGVSANTTTGAVQLGVPCNSTLPTITANAFTADRVVPIGNFNLWFATYTGDKGGVGIGGQPASTPFCGTGNTLEISANGASKYGTTSSSGLRFTKLKSTDTPTPNGTNGIDNTKILSVDQDGDVVLVDAVGGTGIGNYCSQPQNPLTGNYEIPLHNSDFIFQDLSGSGRILLGDVYCGSGSNSRVYIRNNSITSGWQNGISVHSVDPNGIGGEFIGDLNGIRAESQTTNPLSRAGFFVGLAESTVTGILTSDQMFKTNVENIKGATDVLRKLKPHTYKMDVTNFPQFNFQDRLQYGFIAQEVEAVLPNLVHESYMPSELDSLGNEISPAVSYKSLNYNALIPITVQAVNELNERLDKATLSDQTVKTNVQNLANSLDKVKQMRGVSYEWSSAAQTDMNLDSLQHIGFIAQEIAAIEPLLTFEDDSSLVHVNYDRIVPLLVESVKELDVKNLKQDSIIQNLTTINNDLETRLAYLESCIRNANICEESNRTLNNELNNATNQKSIELINSNSIILDQNLPNPFAENTVINYNIPDDVMDAKLMFYDLNGRIIKELIIEGRGESKLTVYGENLQSGIYTYSLIADGKLIATKKMVKK